MADKKISALTASATPLAGTEVLPIVQSGSTVKVAVSDLTAGRAVSASSFTASTDNIIIGTTAKGITTGSAIPLGFGVNNTVSAMTIDTSSNVAIGASAVISSARLTVDRATNNRFNLAVDGVEKFGVYTDAGLVAVYAGSGLPMTFFAGNAERMSISTTGDITAATGNVVIGTAGKGIDFSANTHAAGMTSELLNDYEEGTWTPNFTSWATAPTVAYAQYTRIGRTVHITLIAQNGVCAAASSIDGLPFACGQGGAAVLACAVNTNAIAFTGLILDGRSKIDNLSAATLTASYWTMSATYFV
jgi:hypothetical protein